MVGWDLKLAKINDRNLIGHRNTILHILKQKLEAEKIGKKRMKWIKMKMREKKAKGRRKKKRKRVAVSLINDCNKVGLLSSRGMANNGCFCFNFLRSLWRRIHTPHISTCGRYLAILFWSSDFFFFFFWLTVVILAPYKIGLKAPREVVVVLLLTCKFYSQNKICGLKIMKWGDFCQEILKVLVARGETKN